MSQTLSRPRLPAVLTWADADLPRRAVRGFGRPAGSDGPPALDTGPRDRPFDFSGHVRRLCADVAGRCPELGHIDAGRVLVGITQARSAARHGLQARLTPLRFRRGALERRRGGRRYRVQRYRVGGVEMLYLMTFCLPRFLDRPFDDKFITLFHELYHVAPGFEGDLRRMEGRCALHSRSKRAYDAHMARLARAYLASGAPPALHDFLRLDHATLTRRHGEVVGVVVPRPRMLPVEGDDE
ncbi:MAG: hypothetical protein ACRC33_06420 [Gemmataceae bacterium]